MHNLILFAISKAAIIRPNIIARGSYYEDMNEGPQSFEKHITHHYDFMGIIA